MLSGKGYYRGSSILVTGTAGTGKTSIAAHLVNAACQRGERCLYFAYEEAPSQIVRNMRSIGVDLEKWVRQGLLCFHAVRPSLYGAEMHLLTCQKLTQEFQPRVVIVDPINNLNSIASATQVKSLLLRLIDFFKMKGISALFTSLTEGGEDLEQTSVGVSSLMDTWLLVKNFETNGERNRGLYVLKARGMAHSNQVREFRLTDHGIELEDVYIGPQGVLTGSARLSQTAVEKVEGLKRKQEIERKKADLERRRKAMQAQIEAIQADFQAVEQELNQVVAQDQLAEQERQENREEMARSRWADQQ
jgi:circadian clock protein KaiC